MWIYDVILIAHLEPVTDPTLDLYKRYAIVPLAVVVDNYDEYEIERLMRKREQRYGRSKKATMEYLAR